MKKAGIDFGLTNVKAYFKDGISQEIFLSTTELRREAVAATLKRFGVTDLCAGGNGPTDGFEQFRQHRVACSDPIHGEISTQANGAFQLLLAEGRRSARRHLVVSIGTGTSYGVVDDDSIDFPLGSAIGAGTVDGLFSACGLPSGAAIDELLGGDLSSFDLTVGEAIPSLRGTPKGHYIASYFAKAARNPPEDQGECVRRTAASAISMLVTDIAARLLIYEEIERFSKCKDVIVLGTMPTKSKVVRGLLEMVLRMIGKNPIFPTRGDYALAVGAYHDIEIDP